MAHPALKPRPVERLEGLSRLPTPEDHVSIAARKASHRSGETCLPADLGHIDVDAVERLEYDDGISTDDDHADAHLLVAGLFF